MNPNMVAKNRTARLVAESKRPAYTTVTKPVVREHIKVVQLESDMGGCYWSMGMPESEVQAYVEGSSYGLSDIDCSPKCWCVREGVYFA